MYNVHIAVDLCNVHAGCATRNWHIQSQLSKTTRRWLTRRRCCYTCRSALLRLWQQISDRVLWRRERLQHRPKSSTVPRRRGLQIVYNSRVVYIYACSMWRTPAISRFIYLFTRSIWKMLGPFATASRCTPPVLRCHSPGVATVARRMRIDVHNNDDNDNNDNAWQRGQLWPHRMGPKIPHHKSKHKKSWKNKKQLCGING